MKHLSRTVFRELKKQALQPLEAIEVSLVYPYSQFDLFYVNNVDPVTFNGQVYSALGFSRQPARMEASYSIDRTSITLDNVNGFWTSVFSSTLVTGARIVIRKIFVGHLLNVADSIVIFDGVIAGPTFDDRTAKVDIRSVVGHFASDLPRNTYSPECNAFLGDNRCKVDMTLPINSRNVLVGPGSTKSRIKSAALLDVQANHWIAGYVRALEGPDAGKARPIESSSVGDIRLLIPFSSDPTGFMVHVRRGCRRNKVDCDGRFNNLLNYRGFAEVPREPDIPV